jgi:ABC-type multidrug transport system ATPase subunit/tRNA A-37 threonylcarbamoyl transferase component Bud32
LVENDDVTAGTPLTGAPGPDASLEVLRPLLLAPGQKLAERFRVEAEIGRGAFGRVYRARDELLDRPVAVKLLLPRARTRLEEQQHFLREARTIARLDHPNIVPLYDAGVLAGVPWMAMRLVDGRSLSAVLRDERKVEAGRATHLLSQLVAALDHAHQRGVVHRDVKPSNVLVEPRDGGDEHVWLLDFGVARAVGRDDAVPEGRVAGTPSYMAPEQITGRRVDARADLFAVGCLACELVTGRRSFEGASFSDVLHKVVHAPAAGIDLLEGAAGPDFASWVLRALAKSPEDRYASARDMLRELPTAKDREPRTSRKALARLKWTPWRPAASHWDGVHAVVTERLSKSYRRGRPVLRDLDLAVPTGSVFALLGSNGSGKTTVLRTAVGLYAPDAGTVRVFGRDPRRHRRALLSRIGYVPEHPAAYPGLRVRELLDFLSRLYPSWDQAYCYRLLARFDLPLDARLRDLSRGLQTKVAVVSGLGHRPELLVLDDPTLGLDAVVLAEFFQTLGEASRREGTTVLIASHHLEELETVADRVAFLKDGRIVAHGPLAELRRRARLYDLTFRAPVGEVPRLEGFRRVGGAPGRLTGVTLDRSPDVVEALRALAPDELTTREPTLKELFVAMVGHQAAAPGAGELPR